MEYNDVHLVFRLSNRRVSVARTSMRNSKLRRVVLKSEILRDSLPHFCHSFAAIKISHPVY